MKNFVRKVVRTRETLGTVAPVDMVLRLRPPGPRATLIGER
jgi:hypothetical protein